MSGNAMFSVAPTELVRARQLSHTAVQWAARAARANLEPEADDSHSNLGWSEGGCAFVSHLLDREQRYQLGFSFASAALIWVVDGAVVDTLGLEAADESAARTWCDDRLSAAGLETTHRVELPYDLESVDHRGFAASTTELEVLGAWYSRAQTALENLVDEFGVLAVSPPSVRCWPHHFDLAMLFVLDEGDPETARSIGVGLSPGDGSYPEPYFYCTPWPTPDRLPEPPNPMHWHTQGFTSLVCPASRIHAATDLDHVLASAVKLANDTLQ